MALPSGLAHSAGFVAESTYGTYVAPTRWLPGQLQLRKLKGIAQSEPLMVGEHVQRGQFRNVTTTSGEGTFATDFLNKGMGLLLQNLMGSTAAPVQQGATAAYLQTHTLTDPVGKFLTAQAAVPDTGGTANPYTGLGVKVKSAEFACGVGENLAATFELDARAIVENESLAAPSYATGLKTFHFGQMGVKIHDSYGSEATVTGVRKLSLKVERGLALERFYANDAGLKSEPLANGYTVISGSIETDLTSKAAFADRYASDGKFALVWEFIGPVIASTYYETIRFKVPAVYLDEGTPQVDGPDLVKPTFNFTARYDGTNNPLTIEYISVDTAV